MSSAAITCRMRGQERRMASGKRITR
jgi:hypothetical protein